MLAQVTMLFSSSRRTVCTPYLPFLRKIEIFQKNLVEIEKITDNTAYDCIIASDNAAIN